MTRSLLLEQRKNDGDVDLPAAKERATTTSTLDAMMTTKLSVSHDLTPATYSFLCAHLYNEYLLHS